MLQVTAEYEDDVQRVPLPDHPMLVGSTSECDLVLPFPGVSRRHAVIRGGPDGLLVTDLGSKNGLVHCGEQVTEILLQPGGWVGLGRAVLRFEEVGSSDERIGVEVQGPSGTASREERGTPSPDGSPQAALRVLRELERLQPHQSDAARRAFLEQGRVALEAHRLFEVLGDQPEEAALVQCVGAPPTEEELARSLAGAEGAGKRLLVSEPGPTGSRFVAAFGSRPESWRKDFFLYLCERLQAPQANGLQAPVSVEEAPGSDELKPPPEMVVGTSPAIRGLLEHIKATVHSDLNVLLTGETGVGKELFARLIHGSGRSTGGPFVAINCAAIPAELLEAELFGVAQRVATGVDARPGLFVQAANGAIFLDEIGEMDARLQAKLLRALQEREVLPVGGARSNRIEARVIASTNRDAQALVQEGGLRADLYYRLRDLKFHIPPLRHRLEDLSELISVFLGRAAAKYGRPARGVSVKALRLLASHRWPGNIRELKSEVERAVLICKGPTLQHDHFAGIRWSLEHPNGTEADSDEPLPLPPPDELDTPPELRPLQVQVDEVERRAIAAALERTHGNKAAAARLMGITRNGLSLKMKRLGLPVPA